VTANQVVAYNLRQAREEAGWTQEETAQRLWPYLGEKWSKASFSVAERSVDENSRPREFDAGELLAFSQVFQKPITYFLTPPDNVEQVTCRHRFNVDRPVQVAAVMDAILPGGLKVAEQVQTLRNVADALERADETAMRKAREERAGSEQLRKEKDDGS
jgi:transcriptional regulator with XRE-family HTH domain